MAKNVHQLKEKLDKYRYGDRSTRVLLRPCILQLGKYTHTHTVPAYKYSHCKIHIVGCKGCDLL